jgi:aspartyl-tRNA(Asn)/glutamyl-tRNA(Gln) amidotransferase subunit B
MVIMLKPTIGIEVHVELKSKTKVYSNSLNSYTNEPNTLVVPGDLGMPGTLPKLNKEVINLALKAALGLNMSINKYMTFDRKSYFYPDLARGYQITQERTPIGYDGYLMINDKKISIERLHIEEDTCKSIHSTSGTLLDYNRSGVPLVEIVTYPVISSPEEAVSYVETLRETLLYLGVSDVKIEEGSMRCDANISLSKDETLGSKVEVKNIGSITGVLNALKYEIERQTNIINNGGTVDVETRRYDDKTNTTISMRKKERATDYRYFPEPDIPPVILTDEYIDSVKENMGEVPIVIREYFKKHDINDKVLNTLMNSKDMAIYLYSAKDKVNVNIGSNILVNDIASYLNQKRVEFNNLISEERFINLINALESNVISTNQLKSILSDYLESNKDIKTLIKEKGLEEISNEKELLTIVTKVIDSNEDSVNDYKNGLDRAIKYLMGQIMKETKGKANPKLVNQILITELDKRIL